MLAIGITTGSVRVENMDYLTIVAIVGFILQLATSTISVALNGEPFLIDGVDSIYQLPGGRHSTIIPKGVLFLAHGCSHSATDWWPSTPTCPTCIGLPVETTIVSKALQNNFAVLAASSSNRQHKCWGPSDVGRIIVLIKQFYLLKIKGNFNIPLHMIGASSGGGFVGFLAQSHYLQPKPSSLCVQISSIHVVKPSFVAPVVFLLMEKDKALINRVTQAVEGIRSVKVLLGKSKEVNSSYFFDYSLGSIPMQVSEKIVAALLQEKLIDSQTHFLLDDPRLSSWRQVSSVLVSKNND